MFGQLPSSPKSSNLLQHLPPSSHRGLRHLRNQSLLSSLRSPRFISKRRFATRNPNQFMSFPSRYRNRQRWKHNQRTSTRRGIWQKRSKRWMTMPGKRRTSTYPLGSTKKPERTFKKAQIWKQWTKRTAPVSLLSLCTTTKLLQKTSSLSIPTKSLQISRWYLSSNHTFSFALVTMSFFID